MALPVTIAAGSEWKLGNLEPEGGKLKRSWAVYGDTPETPMLTEEQINALVKDNEGPGHPFLSPVHDQGSVGECNASATAGAMEDCNLVQDGTVVTLSAADLYHRICGGRDDGSTLEDGIAEAYHGIATTAVVPYQSWQKNYGQAAVDSRKQNMLLAAWLCPTWPHVRSALGMGFNVISGIFWYDSDSNPDQDGWLPLHGSGGKGGHATRLYKLTRRGGVMGAWSRNSWTPRFGVKGDMVIPESRYLTNQGIGGWWAVRVVTRGTIASLPPPKLAAA